MFADSFSSLSCSVVGGPGRDVAKQTSEAQEGGYDMILHTCTTAYVGSVCTVYTDSGMHIKVDLHAVLDASQLEMTVRCDDRSE